MNRIEKKLSQLKATNEKAFITYTMAGHPSLEMTKRLILEQEKAGVDILEIGIPFSDPLADGPVIQDVGHYAVSQGVTIEQVFGIVKEVREESEIPLIFMLYYNTVLNYGLEAFVNQCVEVGVDGLIIPDLPLEEQEELTQFLVSDDLLFIQLVAPTSLKRLPQLLKKAKGFIYCVSSLGVTGQTGNFHTTLNEFLKTLKEQTELPLMLGFGISEPEDIKAFDTALDGVVVGSAFIKHLIKNPEDTTDVLNWCSRFKKGLNYK